MPRIFKAIKGGPSHPVCQDSLAEFVTDDGIAIGVVADGLGSAAHSDEASKLASFVTMVFLAEHLKGSTPSIEMMFKSLKDAYCCAREAVELLARVRGYDLRDCDTTLATAVLIGKDLYFGQSGDSGIIALQADGHYAKVTEEQNDEYGRVYPLSFGEDWWVFGKHPKPVSSVLLTSDGFLGFVCNPLLEDFSDGLYIPPLRFLLDYPADKLNITNKEGNIRVKRSIEQVPDEATNNDDVTVVVIVGDARATCLEDAYYREPDWKRLVSEWHRKHDCELYPSWNDADVTGTDSGSHPTSLPNENKDAAQVLEDPESHE
ncbi:MAG: protein phosphatase 2C domain-containing protein [Coriobacteriales bacterium]|jgi:hypothetical protein|nr:protein phosphatase 2C domain-containing protein [Coriobacteriales bacterium]